MAANQNDEALRCLDAALLLQPRDVNVLNTKGTLLGRLGRFQEALASFERAACERPNDADLQYNIAFALQCQERFADALTRYDRTLQLRPQYPEALSNRGLTLGSLGRYEAAIASIEAALRVRPNDSIALNNLGHVHFKAQRLEDALRAFDAAVRIAPNHLDARSNLGRTLVLLGDADNAIRHFERVLAIDPGFRQAVEGIAVAYRTQERFDDLVAVCRALVARAPLTPSTWVELGAALATVNKREEAEDCLQKAVELDGLNATTYGRIGRALLEMGDVDKAYEAFGSACKLEPRSTHYLQSLVKLKKVSTQENTLAKLTDLLASERDLEPTDRVNVHFSLGKAFADLGDNDRSFLHFVRGNSLQRQRVTYDEPKVLSVMAGTLNQFTRSVVQRCSPGGHSSRKPIFILGMPRSGSTLVEQILAAHKGVIALGELKCFNEAIHVLDAKKGSVFPSWMASLSPADVGLLADSYLSRLIRAAHAQGITTELSDDLRLIDKMPGNFQHAGLIHLALPNAKIIHTCRDPIDTCLSCYQVLFEAVPFSYDLGELGRYYRHYKRLMSVWKQTLPEGTILDVDYESLVIDFESTAKAIVSFCNLEWDAACLSFHKVERAVRTASAAQVRQPLYKSSLKKWRPSDELLRPLLDGLADPRASDPNP